ncbi:hypothetical protein GGR51DRAFT_578527 [Nemania sp. FL0031]|nr:hypothetical protein GGR51DRAFT_578527 [Nemania sp. FL0031]
MAIPLLSPDPFQRRGQLASQYKAIEGPTLTSLFPKGTDITRFSKIGILRGVQLEYNNLSEATKKSAADKLDEAVRLRTQAMPLWPVGTVAETRHWDWVKVLEDIVKLLRTTAQPSGVAIRQNIVQSTPENIANDKKAWVNVDLDIYLQQIAHWRKTLGDIWRNAAGHSEQMSQADIATGCAVRYFQLEMAATLKSNRKWYGAYGSYSKETLDYMKETGADKAPGEEGTGYDIWKLSESLKQKNVKEIQSELQKAEFTGFPQEHARWIVADKARHIDPLVTWLKDIIKRTAKRRNAFTHHEFLTAWLLYTDSRRMVWAWRLALREAALKRLLELEEASQVWHKITARSGTESPIPAAIGRRVAAMNKYVNDVESVTGFAVAHSWADYATVMMNMGFFTFQLLRGVGFLLDANSILRRWPNVPEAVKAEQFCNRYQSFIYPVLGRRPTNENEWKRELKEWIDESRRQKEKDYMQKRLEDYTLLDRYGKGWARLAVIEDSLSLKKSDLEMTQGTPQWWEAIKAQAKKDLRTPSAGPVYQKVLEAGLDWDGTVREWVSALGNSSWITERPKVEYYLNMFKPSADWFESVVD